MIKFPKAPEVATGVAKSMTLFKRSIHNVTDPANPVEITPEGQSNLITVTEGDIIEAVVEIQDNDGNVLPIDSGFVLPLDGYHNSPDRNIPVQFTAGTATVRIAWPNTGRWQVTEAQVNMDIDDPTQHFNFNGLVIKVMEAPLAT